MKDAEWLADLVRHGLVRSSFAPPRPIREVGDLTRYRRTLVENQGSERRRPIKLLEAANIGHQVRRRESADQRHLRGLSPLVRGLGRMLAVKAAS